MRILGIEPNSRGIGFAVLESDNKLIDWGIKCTPRQTNPVSKPDVKCGLGSNQSSRNKDFLKIVEKLLAFYHPDLIVFEDWKSEASRRPARVKRLLYRISSLASKRGIRTCSYSRLQLTEHFSGYQAKTKHDIANFLSQFFSELQPILPKKRKPWMTEDYRMSIFMALAYCLLFYEGARISPKKK